MIKDDFDDAIDDETFRRIVATNRRFYDRAAASFSATRERPWPGWERIARELTAPLSAPADDADDAGGPAPAPRLVTLLDVASGNGRFERFLAGARPDIDWSATAVDGSAALIAADARELPPNLRLRTATLDLLDERARASIAGAFESVVCFGFLHHVPTFAAREALLRWCVERCAIGGRVALSLWSFERNPAKARAAVALQPQATAETGIELPDAHDWWLPWQREPGLWRYCHSFTDREIDALIAGVCAPDDADAPVRLIDRFDGPGPSDRANVYVVFERRAG